MQNIHRRDFLKLLGAGAGGLAWLSADRIGLALAEAGASAFQPASAPRDPVAHVISRLTFGATPALYDYVSAIGVDAFINEQLSPETIADDETEARLQQFPMLTQRAGEIAQENQGMRGAVLSQLFGGWITRALYSERQLYERVVHFWSDHFSVYINKNPVFYFKFDDDRLAIRPHAMGRFRELLGADARSAAMLIYLDNAQSRAEAPNENYARELMELHTLGVNGGYTEQDVIEVARCFTGWSLVPLRNRARLRVNGEPGDFAFIPQFHDNGAKTVLGETIDAGGIEDGEQALDLLARDPSTARFIATKLARRFVSDSPPETLVDHCASVFSATNGDITATLRQLFDADEFWNAPPKFKRPFEYVIGEMRALDYQIGENRFFQRRLIGSLEAMGHIPFSWPAPNGYPDVGAYWMNNMLPRWNYAIAAVQPNRQGGPNYESLQGLIAASGSTDDALAVVARYLYGRDLLDEERQVIASFASDQAGSEGERFIAVLALLISAPAFQFK